MRNEIINVYGMMCDHCVNTVSKAIKNIDGVSDVLVSLKDNSARITCHDSPEITQAVKDAIIAEGYSLTPSTSEEEKKNKLPAKPEKKKIFNTARFYIEGMSCANCSSTIEKSLSRLNGLNKAVVNFSSEKGMAEYDPQIISEEKLFEHIKNIGYRAYKQKKPSEDSKLAEKERFRFIFALLFTIPIILLMQISPFGKAATNYLLFFFATLVQFVSGRTFYEGAFHSLKNRATNMDVLVSLGISSAYFYSLFSLFFIDPAAPVFFDSSAMLITFIMIGKIIEARAKGKTGLALKKLMELQADTALLLKNGKEVKTDTALIRKGDIVKVKPGETIPVDGVILTGKTCVDESMLTGESISVEKSEGDNVTGATINKSGLITVETGRAGNETVLAEIIRLVEEAQNDKAPVQRFADKVSNYFVPVVISAAALTFIYWYFLAGPSLSQGTDPFLHALKLMIAVLVVACPCALGLATPTAIMVGSGVGLGRGILFKKASVLESISKVEVILFDKTGTLTEGKPEVTGVYPLISYSEEELGEYAAVLESASLHPLAEAIVRHAPEPAIGFPKDFKEESGKGVQAIYKGKKIKLGSSDYIFCDQDKSDRVKSIESRLNNEGQSMVFISIDNRPAGVISVSDKIKKDSAESVSRLHRAGITTALVSGDTRESAFTVASAVGIDNIEFRVRPEKKAEIVKKWQKKGFRVAMVGDGINDAPALAHADIGIAIGSGTDVAKESGDLILVNNTLLDLVRAIDIGRKTLATIRMNFFWAFFYNILMIPVAAGAFYFSTGLTLQPEWAGVAMWLSSLTVVLNSLRLKRYSINHTE